MKNNLLLGICDPKLFGIVGVYSGSVLPRNSFWSQQEAGWWVAGIWSYLITLCLSHPSRELYSGTVRYTGVVGSCSMPAVCHPASHWSSNGLWGKPFHFHPPKIILNAVWDSLLFPSSPFLVGWLCTDNLIQCPMSKWVPKYSSHTISRCWVIQYMDFNTIMPILKHSEKYISFNVKLLLGFLSRMLQCMLFYSLW